MVVYGTFCIFAKISRTLRRMYISSSNRLVFISLLRVLSLIMIVFYHSICYYAGLWWYLRTNIVPIWSFLALPIVETGLTCFFYISGFLFGFRMLKNNKYTDSFAFWKNKSRRLLIPYVFWGLIWAIIMPIGGNYSTIFIGIAHLWFLLVLFDLFVLLFTIHKLGFVRITKNHKYKYVDILVILISFSSLYLWKNYTDHHYIIGFEKALFYFPSFLIGFYSAKYNLHLYKNVCFAWLGFFLCGLILLVISFYEYSVDCTIYRLPSILMACCMIVLLRKITPPDLIMHLISSLDKNSMGIYIFNQFIVFGVLLIPRSNAFLCYHTYLGPFIIFGLSFFIPWFLSWIFSHSKYTSWMIGS